MRPIKFRGKREHDKTWMFGGIYTEHNIVVIIETYAHFETVIPETVGLYIGHKDRDGKEIFGAIGEKGGDLLQVANSIIYEVIYSTVEENEEMVASFCLRNQQHNLLFPIDNYAIKNGKIIGNIHDNPELLTT